MNCFFSKITLKRDWESVSKLNQYVAKTPYFYHQLLWDFYSDSTDKKRDFIYRIQFDREWPTFYVVSETLPIDKNNIAEITSKPYHPKLHIGQALHFVLQANPQITTKRADGKSARFDVIQHAIKGPKKKADKITAELIQLVGEEWLQARSEKNGFTLKKVVAHNFKQERLYKRSQENPITYSTLDYEGILTVIDPELFLKTLYRGIGAAKGFGCGLLMVKP